MKLISSNKFICFLILNLFLQSAYAEEQIDIWNKDIKQKKENETIFKNLVPLFSKRL